MTVPPQAPEGVTVMEYDLLKFFHILGAILMGGGFIGVWMADLRSRQLSELKPFAEAVRNIAVFCDGLVVPGALLLLASGTWMIVKFYGGWNFLQIPWLAGMVGWFAFEFNARVSPEFAARHNDLRDVVERQKTSFEPKGDADHCSL
jgi:hypothetical protein